MNDLIDKPQQVRKEDGLDKHKLSVYLGKHLNGFNISNNIQIKQFSGGASNLTYLLEWNADQPNKKQAILRTAPRGANIKGAHDMSREYKVLNILKNKFSYSPNALLYCDDNEIIGRPFYLMQKVEGIIARKSFPMPVTATMANAFCKELINVHVALHEIDINKTGLIDLGKAQGYIQRQITGWNSRYKNALVDGTLPATKLMQWLEDKQPDDTESCLIHNDYKFDNVVLDSNNSTEIISVLDWEMATVGDPLMDLGCSMAYWIEAKDSDEMHMIRMMPTQLEGMMTREQVVDYYIQKSGKDIANFNYYYVFGMFRLAVIAQQIYKRYKEGKTTNKKFAILGKFVPCYLWNVKNIFNKK